MTISLSKNITTINTTDVTYVELTPSLANIKNSLYTQLGNSDNRLCLYDLLYSIRGEIKIPMVTITIDTIPHNASVKLKVIE